MCFIVQQFLLTLWPSALSHWSITGQDSVPHKISTQVTHRDFHQNLKLTFCKFFPLYLAYKKCQKDLCALANIVNTVVITQLPHGPALDFLTVYFSPPRLYITFQGFRVQKNVPREKEKLYCFSCPHWMFLAQFVWLKFDFCPTPINNICWWTLFCTE